MLFLRYYLWVVPHLICGGVAVLAFRKKLYRDYPVFVSLMTFSFFFELWVTWAVALFWPRAYPWSSVGDVVASFVLEVLVLHELVGNLVTSRTSLARLLRPLPRWVAAILTLFAVVGTASLPEGARDQVSFAFQSLDFGLNIIATGLLLAMLLFSRILGIRWRSLSSGIALGLAVTALAELAASPLMSVLGRSSYITLDLVRMSAFHVSAVVWLVYVLRPENNSPRRDSGISLSELEAHSRELERMVREKSLSE